MQQMAAYALVSDGHINEALEKANAMLQQATLMRYDIGIAISHYAIGDTYLNANMTNEAIEEYEIAMQKLYKIADSEKLQEKVLIQLIPTLIRLGRLNEAKDYLEQIEQVKDYRHSRFIENIFQATIIFILITWNKPGNIFRKQKNGMSIILSFFTVLF